MGHYVRKKSNTSDTLLYVPLLALSPLRISSSKPNPAQEPGKVLLVWLPPQTAHSAAGKPPKALSPSSNTVTAFPTVVPIAIAPAGWECLYWDGRKFLRDDAPSKKQPPSPRTTEGTSWSSAPETSPSLVFGRGEAHPIHLNVLKR